MTKAPNRTVLVTDADRGNAVAMIRSLGRAGYRVIAADSKRRSLGSRSRYASRHLVYPPPETAPDVFVEFVLQAITENDVDLVLPLTDEVIQPLERSRERIEARCQLAIPDSEALERVTNKARTLELAKELGVPAPHTQVIRTVDEARSAVESWSWPVVIKPARSRHYDFERGELESFTVSYANDLESLAERVGSYGGRHEILLQEYCHGTGEGVELLAHEGAPLAAFQHRRLAEVPLTGGASAWREAVPLDPELYDHSVRLVEALRWTGLIMVEFRVDHRKRQARLMEINGRVWGSLPLAVHSGMDFPARLARLHFEGPEAARSEPIDDYRVGVRSFELERTLNWIARVLLGRRKHRFLPTPKRRRVFAALAGLLSPRQKLDTGSFDDPKPALAEPFKIARKVCGKVTRRLRGKARRSWQDVRTRIVYKSLDAVLTGALHPGRKLGENLRRLFRPSTSQYARVAALSGVIASLVPGGRGIVRGALLRPRALPFPARRLELLDLGSGSTVFLLEREDEVDTRVLKAYRRTLDQDAASLRELESWYRNKYRTVAAWYEGSHEIVSPAEFRVLDGPLLGRPVVACLQPYIAQRKRDLFDDFSDSELDGMRRQDPEFRRELEFFAKRTLEAFEKEGRCADVLGAENVLVIGDHGSWRLKIIDYGILDRESLEQGSPDVLARLEDRLARLRSLLETSAHQEPLPARDGPEGS